MTGRSRDARTGVGLLRTAWDRDAQAALELGPRGSERIAAQVDAPRAADQQRGEIEDAPAAAAAEAEPALVRCLADPDAGARVVVVGQRAAHLAVPVWLADP